MNPFTDESRDARIKVAVEGFCDTLRSPESLHRIVMIHKPAHMSVGDRTLKALLDQIIDERKVAGDYRGIQRLLDTEFGPLEDTRHLPVPPGTPGAERHKATR